MPLEHIVALREQDWTLEEIAREAGVSRQRISQRLIAAGNSPATQEAQRRAEAAGRSRAYREQRAESFRLRAAQREVALERLVKLARELGVSVYTLGQFVARTGTYRRGGDGPRRGKLPTRNSPAGQVVAKRAREASAPWSPHYLSGTRCAR